MYWYNLSFIRCHIITPFYEDIVIKSAFTDIIVWKLSYPAGVHVGEEYTSTFVVAAILNTLKIFEMNVSADYLVKFLI